MDQYLPLWQRLVVVIIAVLAISYLFGLLWEGLLGRPVPGYVAGVVGGIATLPIWSLLKRTKPSAK